MKVCERCSKEIVDRNRLRSGRFCSRSCRDKASYWTKRKLIDKICPQCGADFQTIRTAHICCSLKCSKAKYQKENRGDTYRASRELVYADKIAKGCSRCSERRPSCLQYHHLNPETKVAGIGVMVQRYQPEVVAAEMAKCVLLCANCHFVEENGDGYVEEEHHQ